MPSGILRKSFQLPVYFATISEVDFMVRVEQVIERLKKVQEDVGDISLEITIDMLERMRCNISSRSTLQGYLADDRWRNLKWKE